MLKMKKQCEKCEAQLGLTDTAYICSYECTFCETCTGEMGHICTNCGGELVVRPTRRKGPAQAFVSQMKNKFSSGG
jgi:hypothetical protein